MQDWTRKLLWTAAWGVINVDLLSPTLTSLPFSVSSAAFFSAAAFLSTSTLKDTTTLPEPVELLAISGCVSRDLRLSRDLRAPLYLLCGLWDKPRGDQTLGASTTITAINHLFSDPQRSHKDRGQRETQQLCCQNANKHCEADLIMHHKSQWCKYPDL